MTYFEDSKRCAINLVPTKTTSAKNIIGAGTLSILPQGPLTDSGTKVLAALPQNITILGDVSRYAGHGFGVVRGFTVNNKGLVDLSATILVTQTLTKAKVLLQIVRGDGTILKSRCISSPKSDSIVAIKTVAKAKENDSYFSQINIIDADATTNVSISNGIFTISLLTKC